MATPQTSPNPRALVLAPRLTQFYQGLVAGSGDLGFEYGAKADLLFNADLAALGLWKGLSMTVHAEYNFGSSVNKLGGVIIPVNTALRYPGTNDFDFSSVFFTQKFGDSAVLRVGKMNMIDLGAGAPFRGGAGIDSFWNLTFAAPPSGTVPPYLFGALLNVRTKGPDYNLWVYDPDSQVNRSGLNNPFANGATVRANVNFPVTMGMSQLVGHQGFVALYSSQKGTDLSSLGDTYLPPPTLQTPGIKNTRYYFAYTFDQYLYQSQADPKQGFGLFGQFGISEGNPNRLYWSALAGLGGTGLTGSRGLDNWGLGLYYDTPSPYLYNLNIRNEYGSEFFYNFAITRELTLGADLQIIPPGEAFGLVGPGETPQTAVVTGVRATLKF